MFETHFRVSGYLCEPILELTHSFVEYFLLQGTSIESLRKELEELKEAADLTLVHNTIAYLIFILGSGEMTAHQFSL